MAMGHRYPEERGSDAFDRVSEFINEIIDLAPDEIERKVKEIEPELLNLFKRVERVHALSDNFQQVDLSGDMLTLLRMLEKRKVVKSFPFLSRAAGLL